MSSLAPPRDSLLRARSWIGRGKYLLGAGGYDPGAGSPESTLRGRLGCDYAGFLAWCLGYRRLQRGFTSASDWINADSMIDEAETRGAWFAALAEPELGSLVSFCSIALERDGRPDRLGHAALIVSLPGRWTNSDAGWAAMRIIQCAPSIQRRRGFAIDETHAAAWGHRATFRGVSHPRWRTRFLRLIRIPR